MIRSSNSLETLKHFTDSSALTASSLTDVLQYEYVEAEKLKTKNSGKKVIFLPNCEIQILQKSGAFKKPQIRIKTEYKQTTGVTVSELTSESPVCSLDSPENHTAASLLNPAGRCYSGPTLSDGRGWTSELRPERHS